MDTIAAAMPGMPLAASRPDIDIQDEVWDALWSDGQIRTLERGNFDVQVAGGVVTLVGHVASTLLAEAAMELAASVPGVVEVVNHMVADADLEVAVSEALAANPHTRSASLRVNAFHGWINISGEVDSAAAQDAARTATVGVPGVRGVLGLPQLAGAEPAPLRRALQPPIGAMVYSDDGPFGRVKFVVINPRNRLVEAVGVQARFEADGRSINSEIVVPAEDVQAVSRGGVFLPDSLQAVAARADQGQPLLSAPAPGWQPPFPYQAEQVRWPEGAQA